MASIVAPSDFTGMIMIAQVNSPVDVGVSQVLPVSVELQTLIDTKEPEVLTELLGYNFYRAFRDGLAADPTEQRWLDLRDGKEYQDTNGVWYKYNGIKPIITRFVYYWYLRNNATQTNGVGEAINDTENAQRTSPAQKQVTAWNDMVAAVKNCYCFIHSNSSVYPEAPEFNCCYGGHFSRWFYEGQYRYWRRCNLLSPINVLSI